MGTEKRLVKAQWASYGQWWHGSSPPRSKIEDRMQKWETKRQRERNRYPAGALRNIKQYSRLHHGCNHILMLMSAWKENMWVPYKMSCISKVTISIEIDQTREVFPNLGRKNAVEGRFWIWVKCEILSCPWNNQVYLEIINLYVKTLFYLKDKA